MTYNYTGLNGIIGHDLLVIDDIGGGRGTKCQKSDSGKLHVERVINLTLNPRTNGMFCQQMREDETG
jgi:hypothetical protein